jgi:hypothetical protein
LRRVGLAPHGAFYGVNVAIDTCYFGCGVSTGKRRGRICSAIGAKRIELFPHGTHDDLFDHDAWEKTRAFLASLGG